MVNHPPLQGRITNHGLERALCDGPPIGTRSDGWGQYSQTGQDRIGELLSGVCQGIHEPCSHLSRGYWRLDELVEYFTRLRNWCPVSDSQYKYNYPAESDINLFRWGQARIGYSWMSA